MSRDQLQSLVGYASQMINILTEQNVRAQLAQLRPGDILISPDLGNLSFIDFAAAPKFVELRIQAAEAMRPQLTALADTSPEFAQYEKRFIVAPQPLPEKLDFVSVEGTHYANPEVLESQMQTQPDQPFTQGLESDLARLYGRGDFEADRLPVRHRRPAAGAHHHRAESVGTQFPALRALIGRLAGRDPLQPDGWPQACLGEQPRRVDERGHPGRRAAARPSSTSRSRLAILCSLPRMGSSSAPPVIFGETRTAEYSVLTETAGVDVGAVRHYR
jgi:hypothetical protein